MGNSSSAPVPLEKPESGTTGDAVPSVVVVSNYKPTPPEIPPLTPKSEEAPKPAEPMTEIPVSPGEKVEAKPTEASKHIPAWRRLGPCPCEACKVTPKVEEVPKPVEEVPKSEEATVPAPEPKPVEEVPKPVEEVPKPVEEPSIPVPEPTPEIKEAAKKGWFTDWFIPSTKPTPLAETPKVETPDPEAIPAAAAPEPPPADIPAPEVPPAPEPANNLSGSADPEASLNENVRKTCIRCNQDFEVPKSNAHHKLCGRQQCFAHPDARRRCRYCDAEFVSLGVNDRRVHCNSVKCSNHHARRHIYRQTSKYSIKAIAWLNSIAKREGIVIYHAQNKGELAVDYQQDGNKRFYYVDGFCEETNTIYEFYGDYYHGNPAKYKADDVNKDAKKTFGQLYVETQRREKVLRSRFNMVTIWEAEYDTQFLVEALESQA